MLLFCKSTGIVKGQVKKLRELVEELGKIHSLQFYFLVFLEAYFITNILFCSLLLVSLNFFQDSFNPESAYSENSKNSLSSATSPPCELMWGLPVSHQLSHQLSQSPIQHLHSAGNTSSLNNRKIGKMFFFFFSYVWAAFGVGQHPLSLISQTPQVKSSHSSRMCRGSSSYGLSAHHSAYWFSSSWVVPEKKAVIVPEDSEGCQCLLSSPSGPSIKACLPSSCFPLSHTAKKPNQCHCMSSRKIQDRIQHPHTKIKYVLVVTIPSPHLMDLNTTDCGKKLFTQKYR